jgi:hypothetical protein
MASNHVILMGKLSDSEIKAGVEAAAQRTQAVLSSSLGKDFRITTIAIATQHEVAANNKTVKLKHIAKEIRLRRGLFEGATVRVVWNRRRNIEARMVFDSGVEFEKWMLYGALGAALLLAVILVFFTNAINCGRIAFFFVFMILLIPMLIPYIIFRIISKINNRRLVDKVASIVKANVHNLPG